MAGRHGGWLDRDMQQGGQGKPGDHVPVGVTIQGPPAPHRHQGKRWHLPSDDSSWVPRPPILIVSSFTMLREVGL